ncbi:hypothetical protein ACLOJK_024271 [Asimina triloba]
MAAGGELPDDDPRHENPKPKNGIFLNSVRTLSNAGQPSTSSAVTSSCSRSASARHAQIQHPAFPPTPDVPYAASHLHASFLPSSTRRLQPEISHHKSPPNWILVRSNTHPQPCPKSQIQGKQMAADQALNLGRKQSSNTNGHDSI